MTTNEITLTSGEKVKAERIDANRYRLPGGRVVKTWTDEDGQMYQDSESDDSGCEADETYSAGWNS